MDILKRFRESAIAMELLDADEVRPLILGESMSVTPTRLKFPSKDGPGYLRIGSRFVTFDSQNEDRPFFLGEPFPKVWIEPMNGFLFQHEVNGKSVDFEAILLRREGDQYRINWISKEGVYDDFLITNGDHVNEPLHLFLFELFRQMARTGQVGAEKLIERFRVGSGHYRKQVKIKDVVFVRRKGAHDLSVEQGGRVVAWSHRWEVAGHWRRLGEDAIGKDEKGSYLMKGWTWVVPHTKGPDEKELVKKIRFYKTG